MIGLAGCALWLFGGWLVIAVVTAPERRAIAPIAALAGRPVTAVTAVTGDDVEVRGWLVDASSPGVVIVFAGRGGNRASGLGLARFYVGHGWSVLLPDLRATGESGGSRMGLGYLERLDVRAWVEFVRSRGFVAVGLHGESLGAAAIAYSLSAADEPYALIVLDSCYDDLRNALANRLPWVPIPRLTLKPVEWFGSAALGVGIDALRPLDLLGSVACPVLFLAGDHDSKVLPAETQRLFEACGSMHKALEWIRGGHHSNLWGQAPADYEAALGRFLGGLPAESSAAQGGPSRGR